MYRQNQEDYYRFFTSKTCKYIRVVGVPIKGDLKVEIATPKTWADDFPFVYLSQRSGYNEISVCPTDPQFAPGTFYIRITSTTDYLEYSLLVETIGNTA